MTGADRAAAEERALAAVDADALVALAAGLVRIRSLGGAETPAQECVADALADAGLTVDRWWIDLEELARHPDYSAEVERTEALGVVGILEGHGPGRSLALNGHVDVVPAGDEAAWRFPPWEARVVEGRLWGRGAADMKGGLAAAVHAVAALRRSGVRLAGRLLVHSVVGEEDGGAGTLATLQRGHRADGGIVLEPTALAVAPAQAGALNFRIRVPGAAAHACVREEGVNPLDKLPAVYGALQELEALRNRRLRHPLFHRYELPFALSVGRVRAGEWPSSVPEELVLEGRYGLAPGEEPAAARDELEEALSRAAAEDDWLRRHPPRVEWWGGRFRPAEIDAGDPLVGILVAAGGRATGTVPPLEGMTYGSDLRHLVHDAGMAAVVYGPGDVRSAHRTDESVAVDELVAAARTLVVAAIRYCGLAAG